MIPSADAVSGPRGSRRHAFALRGYGGLLIMRVSDLIPRGRNAAVSKDEATRLEMYQSRACLQSYAMRVYGGDAARPLQCAAAVRFVATGLAAGFGAAACAGALSHPPAGVATLMASSGCGSGVNVWIASLAAASDWASSRLAISSRLCAESASPCAAARLNHLKDSARFCSTPMPRA